ncbi:Uncharacterised protein [Vibrio cholerae]|nr:Uncharacterised protein [Vibrio cholerae]
MKLALSGDLALWLMIAEFLVLKCSSTPEPLWKTH